MNEDIKLNVLWVDDIPTEEFMNEAYEYGLVITAVKSVNSGIAALKDKTRTWDAIILDANCKITDYEQEQPDILALKKAVQELVYMRIDIPWFVYTGGDYEGVENLKYIINERDYDDKLFYEKPKDRYELYDQIKRVVADRDIFVVRKKYADVCNFYKDSDLVALLLKYESDSFDTDKSVPHSVRLIIEWVMRYLEGVGLLPIAFTGTNIARCSLSLGDIPQIVPIHVARSLHFCVEVCNNGSHSDEITSYIVSGEAPYLNKSIVLNLLNILQWCPTLQRYDKEELKKKVIQYQQETREEREKRRKVFK